ncbi:MAG: ATP-binding domain-containing protein [Myxococcales bacterium]|nr:ATP-binding domain-containing protein [Polyangiaceae bacterium]MDW8251659.1 ATP-binding domain-containing protein [Myxococcales bacterium]
MAHHHIPEEEERLLERVKKHLEGLPPPRPQVKETQRDYEQQLLELRDEIAQARLEDVPALVAQMERISGVAARRAEVQEAPIDIQVPYFAHLRLKENNKERDVLIGRGTHIDARSGVRIVDWRHAPISQLYYRYPEGASYEESFGGREVEGEVLVRRTITIHKGKLLRIQSPQGTFVCQNQGQGPWKHHEVRTSELAGGQGTAARPRGTLGAGLDSEQRLDRHLPEIAALLDPRQFELISAADSGIVVIQGGAGSGKTTIGLHRIAYLAYRDPGRFQPDRMLVITYGPALGAYISEVLPSLGVPGVKVVTFQDWAKARREAAFPWLEAAYEEDTPPAVTRLKKHPALLKLLTERVTQYLHQSPKAPRSPRVALALWAEVLSDREALAQALESYGDALSERELNIAHRWCSERCIELMEIETRAREAEDADELAPRSREEARPKSMAEEDEEEVHLDNEEDEEDPGVGVDGQEVEARIAHLDPEDDALLLRLYQLLCGPLKKGKHALVYEHIFVDEAQDLAPVELAVLLDTVSPRRSVTLAGDTAQKLYLDNGFRDWRSTLDSLGLSSTEIEPLRIAYRSTREVMEFAREVLGPLADPTPPIAPRSGAPVEAYAFPQQGAAVAFLADALRPLFAREPRASVGILARFPEQADAYYEGLIRSEIPGVRRVRNQDFIFRPGVDVTDIRQVKGLEFDYVVLVDVNASVFPPDHASRHLLHIAATRAAHQLWVIFTGPPSPLLPQYLIEQA